MIAPALDSGRGHLVRLGNIHPEWLLAQHGQPAIEGGHRDLEVCLVGCRDDDGVDLAARQHRRPVGERVGIDQLAATLRVRSRSRPQMAVIRPIGWSASAGRYIASAHQLVPTSPTRTVSPIGPVWQGSAAGDGAVCQSLGLPKRP